MLHKYSEHMRDFFERRGGGGGRGGGYFIIPGALVGYELIIFIYLCLFILVLKSPSGEWTTKNTYIQLSIPNLVLRASLATLCIYHSHIQFATVE